MEIELFLEVCKETMDEYSELIKELKICKQENDYWRQKFIYTDYHKEEIVDEFLKYDSKELAQKGACVVLLEIKKKLRKKNG